MIYDKDIIHRRMEACLDEVRAWRLFARHGELPSGVDVLTPEEGLSLVDHDASRNWNLQQQGRATRALGAQCDRDGMNALELLKVWDDLAGRSRAPLREFIERSWLRERPSEPGYDAVRGMASWCLLHFSLEVAMDFDFGDEASYRWSAPIFEAGYAPAQRLTWKRLDDGIQVVSRHAF